MLAEGFLGGSGGGSATGAEGFGKEIGDFVGVLGGAGSGPESDGTLGSGDANGFAETVFAVGGLADVGAAGVTEGGLVAGTGNFGGGAFGGTDSVVGIGTTDGDEARASTEDDFCDDWLGAGVLVRGWNADGIGRSFSGGVCVGAMVFRARARRRRLAGLVTSGSGDAEAGGFALAGAGSGAVGVIATGLTMSCDGCGETSGAAEGGDFSATTGDSS